MEISLRVGASTSLMGRLIAPLQRQGVPFEFDNDGFPPAIFDIFFLSNDEMTGCQSIPADRQARSDTIAVIRRYIIRGVEQSDGGTMPNDLHLGEIPRLQKQHIAINIFYDSFPPAVFG